MAGLVPANVSERTSATAKHRVPYADISAVRPASNNAAKRSVGCAVSMTSPRALLQQGLTQLRDQIINQHPSISAGLFALANKQTGK